LLDATAVGRSIAGVSPAERTCISCQTPLPSEALFCPRCGVASPTQISGGGTATVVAPSDETAEQQRRVQAALGPDYDVQRRIGSGGFAEVWAAFDRKLQRTVAVKVMHPELVASRALLERFQREAQAVAKLRHPGIIPIYAVGQYEGLAYYIMPLVEGESLRDRLTREGPLPPNEVRRVLRETAAALAVAHEAGIVHRDIKPENLMLEGKERRLLVMDFGIAKSTAGTQTGLTGTGMIVGTPTYMSPEQATGSKEVDVRSDVYSLGVVGFELLTGKPPFSAPSVPELMVQHLSTPAPSVAAGRPDVPEDLAIAVNRCLAKEPGERWRDAAELSAFLAHLDTPASQPKAVPKGLRKYARRGWQRWPRVYALLGVLGLAVVGLIVSRGSGPTPQRPGNTVSSSVNVVQVVPSDAMIQVGLTAAFFATAYDRANNAIFQPDTFVWTSSNPNAATIDQNGIATGIATGVTIITARVGTGSSAKSGRATLQVVRGTSPQPARRPAP